MHAFLSSSRQFTLAESESPCTFFFPRCFSGNFVKFVVKFKRTSRISMWYRTFCILGVRDGILRSVVPHLCLGPVEQVQPIALDNPRQCYLSNVEFWFRWCHFFRAFFSWYHLEFDFIKNGNKLVTAAMLSSFIFFHEIRLEFQFFDGLKIIDAVLIGESNNAKEIKISFG